MLEGAALAQLLPPWPQLRRFPYEDYPPHVRDVRNYAFKTLVLEVWKGFQVFFF